MLTEHFRQNGFLCNIFHFVFLVVNIYSDLILSPTTLPKITSVI